MTILIIISCICFIFIIGRIFFIPLKWIGKIIINSILGGLLIFCINMIGIKFGFHIGLNFITSVLVRSFRYSGKYFPYISKNVNIKITKGEYLRISPLVWKCFN